MVAPLPKLLSESWSFSQKHAKILLTGAVVFGLLLSGIQVAFGVQMMMQAGGAFRSAGFDVNKMEDIAKKMDSGDESAKQAMMDELQKGVGSMKGKVNFTGIGITFVLIIILILSLNTIAGGFYFLVALGKGKDILATFQESARVFFPLLGLYLWVALRTFAWIPVVGFIFAIILGPRFILSPVLLLRDKKGVFESAKISYAKTKGYWGKIFGNMIAVGILCVIGLFVASFVSVITGPLIFIMMPILMHMVIAFGIIFTTKLSVGILGTK